MIYIFLILFFSFLILNHLFNTTYETFVTQCKKLNPNDCANLIADENTNILASAKNLAKLVKNGLNKADKTLEKTHSDVAVDTNNKDKLEMASKGENVRLTNEQSSKLKIPLF